MAPGGLPGRLLGSRGVPSIGPEAEIEDGKARRVDCPGSRVDICGHPLEFPGPGLSPSPWSPHEVGYRYLALDLRSVLLVAGLPLWIGLFGAGLLDERLGKSNASSELELSASARQATTLLALCTPPT